MKRGCSSLIEARAIHYTIFSFNRSRLREGGRAWEEGGGGWRSRRDFNGGRSSTTGIETNLPASKRSLILIDDHVSPREGTLAAGTSL